VHGIDPCTCLVAVRQRAGEHPMSRVEARTPERRPARSGDNPLCAEGSATPAHDVQPLTVILGSS